MKKPIKTDRITGKLVKTVQRSIERAKMIRILLGKFETFETHTHTHTRITNVYETIDLYFWVPTGVIDFYIIVHCRKNQLSVMSRFGTYTAVGVLGRVRIYERTV